MAIPAVVAVIDPTVVDVAEAVADLVDDTGADLTFEVAGASASSNGPDGRPLVSLNDAIASTRRGGRIVCVATHPATTIEPNAFVFKELTIVGTAAYTATDFRRVIALMGQGHYEVSPWIEHRTPDQLITAMNDMRRGLAAKVLIDVAGNP